MNELEQATESLNKQYQERIEKALSTINAIQIELETTQYITLSDSLINKLEHTKQLLIEFEKLTKENKLWEVGKEIY